jgi:hypothetical protein
VVHCAWLLGQLGRKVSCKIVCQSGFTMNAVMT